MATTSVTNVKRNGFYRLMGQVQKEAYQVMELHPKVMTVTAGDAGFITKPYDNFELVEDTTGYTLHKWPHEIVDDRIMSSFNSLFQ